MAWIIFIALVVMFRKTIIDIAMELTVYSYSKADATWRLWAAFGYEFVTLKRADGSSCVAHLVHGPHGDVCQYPDNHGLLTLAADGSTNDATYSWAPLTGAGK